MESQRHALPHQVLEEVRRCQGPHVNPLNAAVDGEGEGAAERLLKPGGELCRGPDRWRRVDGGP